MKWTIYALVVISFIALALAVRGQSITDANPTRIQQARFQCAYYLFSGQWNERQRNVLMRCVENPLEAKDMEVYIRSLFKPEQTKQIFYNLKSINLERYAVVRATATFAEERTYLVSQTIPVRADLWRIKMADNAAGRTPEQLAFMIRVGRWLDDPKGHRKEGDKLLKEALSLFDPATAREIFGAVGTHQAACNRRSTVAPLDGGGTCNCNYGSYFNLSCSSECGSPNGSCTATDDGCGFLGFYTCNSGCTPKEDQ